MLNQRVSQVPVKAKRAKTKLQRNKRLTYRSLSNWIAELDGKFKSDGSTGAGETDAKHKQERKNSFENIWIFEGDELLCNQRASNEDETRCEEKNTDGKFHLLAKEVHHGGDANTGADWDKADDDPKVVGERLGNSDRDVRWC